MNGNDCKTGVSLLKLGQAPGNGELIRRITVGADDLAGFIKEKYFADYIALGGSKIKFVTGKAGSGKTHFLQLLSLAAKELGFTVVGFSAKDVWLHDFGEIYSEIVKGSDLTLCLGKCAEKIVNGLGYDFSEIGARGQGTFADYLSSIGEFDALIKREIRNQLRAMFLKNPLLDNNFAIAVSLLTGGILGCPVLESASGDMLLSWLMGGKDINLRALRGLGLSPAKITRHNARHMLRSLAEVHRIASVPGIVVMIDNTEILVRSTSLDPVRYTRLKREDAYESIRELIDEIDTMGNLMFFYAFDRELIDNELFGIKSYQALWMRVQNEIVSDRFNRFTDIIDLDRLWAAELTEENLLELSGRVAEAVNEHSGGAARISGEMASRILSKAGYAKTSLPRQTVLATTGSDYGTGDLDNDGF
ncbi:MAG: DUF2791 family P-loop domain-containing protein [Firmicutes bacterium]|nr:DUF2791 family P-loop domain-containing protein [Bacillota bacterium]